MIQQALPPNLHPVLIELLPYFALSFGNETRLDYGTGHEATFAAFLCCLWRLGLIQPQHFAAVVTRVFRQYLVVTRRLQTVYWLEPAGSHGVWGLDDYQFLPFYFGASQLMGTSIPTNTVMNRQRVEELAPEYLYMDCIRFILQVCAVTARCC